ncbi:hypothetical protein BC827DRAFT_1269364 [Russula dissimulans]|nr:hypothetical protein BC827DRAFT_1269364 [Russula dissimulans]
MASHSPHEYLDALLNAIPYDSVPPEIASPSQNESVSPNPYVKFIDTALRLVCGGPARSDDSPALHDAWPEIQPSIQRTLHALHPSSQPPAKRKHSPPPSIANKKLKHGDGEIAGATEIKNGDDNDNDVDDDDDAPHLTLHALRATAPVRHKVDITLHARTLRLAHSMTNAASGLCARAALTRAFLLPTRARSNGASQWTVLLLAGDKPSPPASRGRSGAGGSAAAAVRAASVRFELACSVLDSSIGKGVPRLTVHPPPTSTSVTSAFEAPSLPIDSSREVLLAFLSSSIRGTPVTLTTVERGTSLAGITAFRGVKETSLWFFDGAGAGVLADARPAEFWALADLARGEAGVRVRTATGRTCSVVLMRRRSADAGGNDEEEEEEEEEGEETEFQMIDGKERERILEWVRKYRGAFGRSEKGLYRDEAQGTTVAAAEGEGRAKGKGKGKENEKGKGKDREQQIDEARGDSDDDSDFEVESGESDGGSPSSSGSGSDSDRAEEHEPAGGSGSGSEEAEVDSDGAEERGSGRAQSHDDDGDDDDEVVELDPKHHPLLRAGALPKMSRAAIDAAVGLVVGDLIGTARHGPGLGSPNGQKEHGHEDEGDDEEEDELDD